MSKHRGHGEGSIYQRSDGRWAAAVTTGYDAKGSQRRRYVYAATRRAVAAKLAKLQEALRTGEAPTPYSHTVGEYLTWWLEHTIRPVREPSTVRSYEKTIASYIAPGVGHLKLGRLTAADVQTLIGDLSRRGFGARTVQYAHSVLRNALNEAVRYELVARNPAIVVKVPSVRSAKPVPLTSEESRRFLAAVAGHRLEALWAVALALGLRQGEALGLTWSDVDLDRASLTVRQSLKRDGQVYVLREPKTPTSRRTIPLPGFAGESLRRHHARQSEERLRRGSVWQDSGLVFTSETGGPLNGTWVTHTLGTLLHDAGLPHQSFQALRHTAATLLVTQGVHPRVAMRILGHSQIGLTMNVYSGVVDDVMRDAIRGVDAALG